MPSLDSKARHLTKHLQQLINRFQFLKSDVLPPDYEFNFREYRVIFHLGYNGPGIMREIADTLGIPVSTATGVVDRMVEKDLVQRERSKEDRRLVKVDLTEKGREVYRWDYETHVHFVKQMLKCLDLENQKIFVNLMETISAGISRATDEPER